MTLGAQEYPEVQRSLIVEGGFTGHLLVYVRVLAERAISEGHEVLIALTRSGLESSEFAMHLGDLSPNVSFVSAPSPLSPIEIEALASRMRVDHVVIPHGDPFVGRYLTTRIRARTDTSLLVMRDPRWEYPARGRRRFKNLVKLAAAQLLARRAKVRVVWLREPLFEPSSNELFAIDPFIADGSLDEIRFAGAALRKRMQAAAASSRPFWFGITGAISARKNVGLVLDALQELRLGQPDADIGLAVVGTVHGEDGYPESTIRERCEAANIQCYVENRHLTNFEMNAAVVAFDAVVMAYSTHAPNSTLGKAYALGTRLIAAGPPSIRRFVQRLEVAWDSPLDRASIVKNMSSAMLSPAPDSNFSLVSVDAFASRVLGYGARPSEEASQK